MEKRVKLFVMEGDCSGCKRMEREINDYLQSTKGKLLDIKFSSSQSSTEEDAILTTHALLIYTPEV